MPDFATVLEELQWEAEPIKGSRFLAVVTPISDEQDGMAAIQRCRSTWPQAGHACWAWSLADGRTRANDDGEPGGSAGRPILAQIEGHGLTNVCVVVLRWFGGTKLGVGGLIRAYGGTAGKALDQCETLTVAATVRVRILHTWNDTGAVQGLLDKRGLAVEDIEYDTAVTRIVVVPEDQRDSLAEALRERTSGRAEIVDSR